MTLYECKFSAKQFDPEAFAKNSNDLEKWTKSHGVECSSSLYSNGNWDSCITPVATYSYGGTSSYLPDHVGIPFSGSQKYYMLEIHYENPIKRNFIDNSGFRIHYTSKLRQFDAGIMTNGVSISETQLIPPRQKSFRNIGICGPLCEFKKECNKFLLLFS
jgi:Copper type II ascorbate-dependent monooxygenase, N-terminal domain